MAVESPRFKGFQGFDPTATEEEEEEEGSTDTEWGGNSDESDISDDESHSESTQFPQDGDKAMFTGQSDFGMAGFGAGKLYDLAEQQLQKRRWISIKILNMSTLKVLKEPHWVFKDGKTEVNPTLFINKNGGEGEARFKGRTLKGALSYEISDTFGGGSSDVRMVIIFKVLFFQGFQKVKLGTDRANQVGVTTVNRRGSSWTDTRSGKIYKNNKSCLKHNSGEYHTHMNATIKPLKFRFSISDTGDAEVKVVVTD